MTTPFESAGFTVNQAPQTSMSALPTRSASETPVNMETKPDEFVSSQNIDKDALKEELKEEITQELQAEKELEQKEEDKKKKLGPIDKFKRFIGNMKKAGITAGEYIKGFFRGAAGGGVAGAASYGALTAAGKILTKKAPESTSKITKLFKSSKTAKAAGIGVAAIGMISSLWKASLDANEKRALTEHKWENTPVVRTKKNS